MSRYISKTIIKKRHIDNNFYFYIEWEKQRSFLGFLVNKFKKETDRICFKELSQAEDYCLYATKPICIEVYREGPTYKYATLQNINIDVVFSQLKDVPRFLFDYYEFNTATNKEPIKCTLAKDIFRIKKDYGEIVKTYKI